MIIDIENNTKDFLTKRQRKNTIFLLSHKNISYICIRIKLVKPLTR